ncbi:MAG: NADH-quinone oxidoreductase subunit N [Solirubrobacterales bacterium]|nr:NADH-quinone oxidoreductase subunit N [Solirubrobacterales bacterium]
MNVVTVAHQTAVHHLAGPHIDWTALSPLLVLTAGGLLVLLVGLLRPALVREWIVPGLTILTFLCAVAAEIVVFHHHATGKAGFCVVAAPGCGSAPLAIDRLALELYMLFAVAGLAAVLMSWRGIAVRESGHGEFNGLLIFSVLGMCVFVSAQNLITLFLGIELLSIPLYILCASETRREGSLESGLKYLVVGSVGSATLVYGLGLIYGATGSTDFTVIGSALSQGKLAGGGTAMVFTGLALTIVGFAFKASVAPFHQWTPDVYEGAPTAITAFMATATKAAALGAFLRFFDVAAIGAQDTWAPMLATVAAITIVVGNVGALGQSSLKRMMGYSGVAQAGYMLSGVVVGSRLGIQATVLYLIAYLFMNLAPFAVIVAEEHERPDGDYLSALAGLGARRPWLAWPMTIGMLGLAGIPGTVGFIGKFQLINALVSGAYTWLAIVLVIGSMISLGYYLRVVATIWMRPAVAAPVPAPATGPGELAPIAGGSLEADEWEEGPGPAGGVLAYPELVFVAVAFAAAVIFFGVFPSPLFNFTAHAANALSGLF